MLIRLATLIVHNKTAWSDTAMKTPRFLVPLLVGLFISPLTQAETCPPLLQQDFQLLHDTRTQNLCEFKRQVLLVVNTASRCGFTPQLKGLEALYERYKDQGFSVLGFPSNDFFQELGEEEEIASFCKVNYGVTFPMFSKSSVRGNDANPLFSQLADQSGTAPKWNFYKYLIDRNGKVVDVYSSRTTPEDKELVEKIEALLKP